MVDEKDELPDLNEDLPEDEAGDDFFSESSEGEDLLDADFGDADAGISTEEEGEASFEEVAEGDDLSVGDDNDFFSSEPGDGISVEVEVVFVMSHTSRSPAGCTHKHITHNRRKDQRLSRRCCPLLRSPGSPELARRANIGYKGPDLLQREHAYRPD